MRTPAGGKIQRVFDTRAEAEVWAGGLEVRKQHGAKLPVRSARKLTLAAYYQSWSPRQRGAESTAKKDIAHWRNHLEPEWGRVPLIRITPWGLDQWVTELHKKKILGPASIRSVVYLLSKILSGAKREGLIETNPVAAMEPLPKVPESEFRVVDRAEITSILAASARPYQAMWLVAWETGMRWAEFAGVPVRAVDLDAKLLRVVQVIDRNGEVTKLYPKGGKHRAVPLSDLAVELLAPLVAGKGPEEFVFTASKGGPLRYHNVRKRVWLPTLAKADLDPGQRLPGMHQLRHSAGTNLLAKGASMVEVQAILGWSDLRMAQVYVHRNADYLARAPELLNEAPLDWD